MAKVAAVLTLALGGCGRIGFDLVGESCLQLTSPCGTTGTCCDSPIVPGGTFARSFDVASDGLFADASFVATVRPFRLDTYEVTVGRFRAFVDAGLGTRLAPPAPGDGAHANIANSGWDAAWNASLATDTNQLRTALHCDPLYENWTEEPAGNENRPINCITWFEALAFCAWDGGYLPTEAEWNFAASAGDAQRAYAWSDPAESIAISCATANWGGGSTDPNACVGRTRDVGVTPSGDGKWGQSDLTGNVWEWTLDWYQSIYPQNPCDDCANLTPATYRTIRGGSFINVPVDVRVPVRFGYDPAFRTFLFGVRCTRPAA